MCGNLRAVGVAAKRDDDIASHQSAGNKSSKRVGVELGVSVYGAKLCNGACCDGVV
jgi:hypothetical protein